MTFQSCPIVREAKNISHFRAGEFKHIMLKILNIPHKMAFDSVCF